MGKKVKVALALALIAAAVPAITKWSLSFVVGPKVAAASQAQIVPAVDVSNKQSATGVQVNNGQFIQTTGEVTVQNNVPPGKKVAHLVVHDARITEEREIFFFPESPTLDLTLTNDGDEIGVFDSIRITRLGPSVTASGNPSSARYAANLAVLHFNGQSLTLNHTDHKIVPHSDADHFQVVLRNSVGSSGAAASVGMIYDFQLDLLDGANVVATCTFQASVPVK